VGGERSVRLILTLLLFLLSFSLPANAQIWDRDGIAPYTGPGTPAGLEAGRTPTLVLLASNLSYQDLQPGGELEPVRELATHGSIALLDTSVMGEATEAAAYLSLSAGRPVTVPGETGPTVIEGGITRTLAELAEDAFPAIRNEGNVVCATYRRRYGYYPPLRATIVHISLPALFKTQWDAEAARHIGSLGDCLQAAGRKVTVFGDWRAALVGMDHRGVIMDGYIPAGLSSRQVPALLQKTDVLILSTEDERELRRYVRAVLPLVRADRIDVMVVAPAPERMADRRRWARPGFVIGAGRSFPENSVFVSDTTGQRGYVSNRDIAPTIARLQNTGPMAGASGAPLRSVLSDGAGDRLSRIDREVRAGALSARPVLIACGVLSGLCLAFAFLVIALQLFPFATPARFGLLLIAAFPLALLPASASAASHIWEYGMVVLSGAALLAVSAGTGGVYFRRSPLALLFVITAAFLLADVLVGLRLIPRSALSGIPLTGVPWVRLTAPYLGILLGCILTAVLLLAPLPLLVRRWLPALYVVGAAVLTIVAEPGWVAAACFLAPALLVVVENRLCDSSRWITEPNE
jgi:hypothetical protein